MKFECDNPFQSSVLYAKPYTWKSIIWECKLDIPTT